MPPSALGGGLGRPAAGASPSQKERGSVQTVVSGFVETKPSIYELLDVTTAKACLTSLFATAIMATLPDFPLPRNRW